MLEAKKLLLLGRNSVGRAGPSLPILSRNHTAGEAAEAQPLRPADD